MPISQAHATPSAGPILTNSLVQEAIEFYNVPEGAFSEPDQTFGFIRTSHLSTAN